MMDHLSAISYAKGKGEFRVLVHPLVGPGLPLNIFIAPDTPWSNRTWLRRVLGECRGYILWLDKHFVPEGLDFLGETADGANFSEGPHLVACSPRE